MRSAERLPSQTVAKDSGGKPRDFRPVERHATRSTEKQDRQRGIGSTAMAIEDPRAEQAFVNCS